MIHYQNATVTVHHGDCIEVLATLEANSVDSVVCDPPYGLGFMGKDWDSIKQEASRPPSADETDARFKQKYPRTGKGPAAVAFDGPAFQQWCELWAAECLRVLKPGGHLLAFGGTRTWHRLACAIEDAGFEIRDSIAWLMGSGFPKSLNVSRQEVFCQCSVDSPYGTGGVEQVSSSDVPGLRSPVPSVTEQAARRSAPGVLSAVSGEAGRGPSGGVVNQRDGSTDPRDTRTQRQPRSEEPGVERRGDAQAAEGELQGGAVRPLSPGVPADGSGRRLHHGAPAGDGSVGRPNADPDGSGEPHRPEPVEQRPLKSGAVPDERGPQAGGVWPVCAGCRKPVVPNGLGTALKPAHEPIVMARKPLTGTVASNVMAWGTGALNIDGCRIEHSGSADLAKHKKGVDAIKSRGGTMANSWKNSSDLSGASDVSAKGRWPANVVLDESQAEALDEMSGETVSKSGGQRGESRQVTQGASNGGVQGGFNLKDAPRGGHDDLGGASRFFYTAKAGADERIVHDGTAHPTVKPLALMRWLVRLVTPPGGTVLEPFAGSGTTVEACLLEGFRCVAVEREADYLPLIVQRVNRRLDPVAYMTTAGEDLGLFGDMDEEPTPAKPAGRWPANVILDRSQAAALDEMSGESAGVAGGMRQVGGKVTFHETMGDRKVQRGENPKTFERGAVDHGGASRFFLTVDDDEAPVTDNPVA